LAIKMIMKFIVNQKSDHIDMIRASGR